MPAVPLEDTTLPTVSVGGREFPIGKVTLHQIFRLKNLIVTLAVASRAKQATLNALAHEAILSEFGRDEAEQRSLIAQRLGIEQSLLEDVAFYTEFANLAAQKAQILSAQQGYDGDVGMLFLALEALSETQLTELATLLLDRYTHSRVTVEFVQKHFDLDWFIEALTHFIAANNIVNLIKNFQRLGITISTQISLASIEAKTEAAQA